MQLLIIVLIMMNTLVLKANYSCSKKQISENNCSALIKLNSAAALGECLPDGPPVNIPSLLAKNNIESYIGKNPKKRGPASSLEPFTNLTDSRIVALARVVEAFDKVGNGKFSPFKSEKPIQVIFAAPGSSATNSRRYDNQIQLTPGNQNLSGTLHQSTCGGVDNHGLIAHELAHFVARNNDSEIENGYLKHMGGGHCRLTKYTTKNRAEEIAEIIAAYITMPQAFAQKGEECTKALSFLKGVFGEPHLNPTCEFRQASYESTGKAKSLNVPYRSNSVETLHPTAL